jgi:hypothetical protein
MDNLSKCICIWFLVAIYIYEAVEQRKSTDNTASKKGNLSPGAQKHLCDSHNMPHTHQKPNCQREHMGNAISAPSIQKDNRRMHSPRSWITLISHTLKLLQLIPSNHKHMWNMQVIMMMMRLSCWKRGWPLSQCNGTGRSERMDLLASWGHSSP